MDVYVCSDLEAVGSAPTATASREALVYKVSGSVRSVMAMSHIRVSAPFSVV
jgi:hypothetical protein